MAARVGKKVKAEEIVYLLSSLVEKNLVVVDETPRGRRYRLLETVRQFGDEELGGKREGALCRAKHRDFFVQLSEIAEPHLISDDAAEWYEALVSDLDNLRAAFDDGLETNPHASLRMAGSLMRFWRVQGIEEGLLRTHHALDATTDAGDTRERGRALLTQSALTSFLGDSDLAISAAEAGMKIGRNLGDGRIVAQSLLLLANVISDQGNFELAESYYLESASEFKKVGEFTLVAAALSNLGLDYMQCAEFGRAKDIFKQSLETYETASLQVSDPFLFNNLGVLHLHFMEFEEARAQFERGIKIAAGFPRGLGALLSNMGIEAACRGDLETAFRYLKESVRYHEGAGSTLVALQGRVELGFIIFERGDFALGLSMCVESVRDFARMKIPHYLGLSIAFASAMVSSVDPLLAGRLWGASLRMFSEGARTMMEHERALCERHLCLVRGVEGFDAAVEEGKKLSADEAVALVLDFRV